MSLFCVPCCAVLCCAVLCCAVLCCAVLCCAVQCSAVPCCAVPCCGVVCCAVLCCAVLCCAVLSKQLLCCLSNEINSAGSVIAVEQLGHGGITTLRKLQEGYDLDASVAIASLTALTCQTSTAKRHGSPVSTAMAIDMLQAAPYLTDLDQWLQWTIAAETSLGPLHTFLQQHGMVSMAC